MSVAEAASADTIQVAFCNGGRQATTLEPRKITFEQFAQLLSKPSIGEKDGSYYIRGGDLRENKRGNENLLSADLLIIDGDSGFDPETGEITPAPPMMDACNVLDSLGLRYVAHTSYSYVPDERWKYRLVIPARMKNEMHLRACVRYIIAKMHAAGVFISDVKENSVWAQPWYLPRVADAARKPTFRVISSMHGAELNVSECVAWYVMEDDEDQTEKDIIAREPARPQVSTLGLHDGSVIQEFNRAHGLGWMRQQLEEQGYKFSHVDKKKNVYRYIRPGSETKIAGVMLFQGKHGDWCTYSHHGAQDPLSHKVCDPFEVLAIFHHAGDRKAAARSLMPARPERAPLDLGPREVPPANSTAPSNYPPELPAEHSQAPEPSSRFAWITKAQGNAPVLNSNWLVKHVLPAEGLGVIFGRPGSGKTFTVMDIAMHVAAGIQWRGKKVRQAAVSYVSPEAGRLGVNRVIGWSRHHGIAWPDGFRLSPAAINLCSDATDAEALIADVQANQPDCRLVVIDTLNRAMAGGDENSGEDMGRFVALCDHIAKQLRAFVLVVHHSGKDAAKGSRGHSSLLGAVSLELEVTKEQGQPGTIKVTKMRDGEDGAEYGFAIDSVPLGVDEDGEEVTTGISIEADADDARAAKKAQPKGPAQKAIAEAFQQYVDDNGRPNPMGTGFPEPGRVQVVDYAAFVDFAAGKMTGDHAHERRKRARQSINGMVGNRFFAVNSGLIWRL